MSVDSVFRNVERVANRVNQMPPQTVERGIWMAERIGTNLQRTVENFSIAAERLPHYVQVTQRMFSMDGADRITRHHRSEDQQRAHDQAAENLEKLGEAGKDLLEAIGWGAAGNLDEAAQHAADAAGKLGELFWRGLPGPGN